MNSSRVSRSRWLAACAIAVLSLTTASTAAAQERLCDVSYEDCRSSIISMIRAETVGLDVSFWFMTDTRFSTEIIRRWQAGVPVRIMLDVRSDENYPAGATVRQSLINAGIPIRHKTTTGINHWKLILYAGQNKLHFSAANFANGSYSPVTTYEDYTDEAIYFTDDPALVHSFMTKYDDLWTNTTHYQNLANINGPLVRNYPTYPIDPQLNFPPDQDYQDRLVSAMRQETQQIDIVMFRITSGKVPDEVIRRVQAGVPVIRFITDKGQYRNTTYFWDSYNIDRMYLAGVPIKWKRSDAVTDQDMHQKSVVLHGRDMAIFGSSNWTTSSSDSQREHNIFTQKTWFVDWFKQQFERKWNNLKADGTPIDIPLYFDYEPGYPETPVNVAPANQALGVGTTVLLKWEGGWWAHKYDIYFGTTNPPPLIASNYMPGSATAGVSSNKESYNPCTPPTGFTSACPAGLEPGVTYYWKIRGKTMLGDGGGPLNAPARAITGPTWSFTTAGGVPPPQAPTNLQGTSPSPTRIDLSWDNVEGEQGYKIERKLASASSTTWAQVGTTNADVTTFANTTGLTPSTAYNYRVRAWTTGGNSPYSNTITVVTLAASPEAGRITADAYVRAGQYASTNYGRATELITKFSGDAQYHRRAFMKLDISAVQPTTSSVTLRVSGRLSDTRAASVTVNVHPVADTTWNETALTWNNQPAFDATPATSVSVSGTAAQWYDIDLTSFITAQRALGRTSVTIALICPIDTLPYATFGSRESSAKPELIITP
jgi:phosphatidylserine/phosphatidylglycerophosphate/cardiolipin synthase-like enzyme